MFILVSVQKSQGQYLFHAVQDSVTNGACFRGLLLWKSSVFKKKNYEAGLITLDLNVHYNCYKAEGEGSFILFLIT